MSRRIGQDRQDRQESVARSFNWTPDLDGATISSASWETGGLTVDSTATSATVTSIRLSGGIPGQSYRVTCRVITTNGEILEAYVDLEIDD
jgi:hypothetical protein